MNKTVKGSLAGAAGIALLMGGFGSYALWSDSQSFGSGSIASGTLDVASSAATLTDQNDAAWSGTDLMVPGDTVTRKQAFTFTGTGKNLKGSITFTPGTPTNQTNASSGVGDAADAFTVVAAVSSMGASVTQSAPGSNCWTFQTSNLSALANTTVTYVLNADRQDLQNVTAAITNSKFDIVQNGTCA